jgi:hypothetical protein
MRTLRFIVDGQTIVQDPYCDFSGLVPGTQGFLQVEFTFSKEWDNTVKVVGFYSNLGKEYEPRLLKDGKTCVVPSDATKNRIFKVQVFGQNDAYSLKTNKVIVDQKGG